MKTHKITIELSDHAVAYLECLAQSHAIGSGKVEDVLVHLAASAADGVRRPGAWENAWNVSAFGDWPDGGQVPDVPYSQRLPLREIKR